MNPTLHPALVEAYAIAPAAVSYVHTIELRHESMSEPLYLVQGFLHKQIKPTVGGAFVTFRACAFEFTLPATDEGGLQELTLTMDNTNNRVSDFCESAMTFPAPVEIYYRPYLSDDLTTPLMDPPLRLFLLDVVVNESQVTGRAAPVDFLNLKFPTELYTVPRFPSLS
jgi:hypothetical protein